MTDKLPPPLPPYKHSYDNGRLVPLFTAYQMRAYAASAVAQERERCAKLCDDSEVYEEDDPGGFFARLIRSQS